MLRQFEIILTAACLVLSAVLLTVALLRMRGIFLGKNARAPIWSSQVGALNRVAKLTMAASLILLVPGIIYFMFVVAVPSAVVRVYAKTLFCVFFSAWVFLEIALCFSIPERLLGGWKLRRMAFFSAAILCGVAAAYLFPLILKSLPYPTGPDCVMLDLPVRGTWLAGHGGASAITNGHLTNRYAIDILKLGPDGRLHKGREEAVTDFYSYGEPIFAPADGRVTDVVDGVESDLMGNMDENNPGGNHVIIDIGNGKYVYFAHLKKGSIPVEKGQSVRAGTLIGHIGNSGFSTHPHLHMHVQNKPTSDPEGRITYPFRFREMRRERLILWMGVRNGYLLRNDRFSD